MVTARGTVRPVTLGPPGPEGRGQGLSCGCGVSGRGLWTRIGWMVRCVASVDPLHARGAVLPLMVEQKPTGRRVGAASEPALVCVPKAEERREPPEFNERLRAQNEPQLSFPGPFRDSGFHTRSQHHVP